jgi:branched-chain amino acid transport system ATP-binding protein
VSAGTAVATGTLEISGLTAGYAGAPVLRDLSLNVSAGEVVALMGANGAGKTTTLRAISGLVKPDAGTIALEGRDMAPLTPTARAPASCMCPRIAASSTG